MKDKEFKVRRNPAVLYFEVMYFLLIIYRIFIRDLDGIVVIIVFGIVIFAFIELFRPYKYVIHRRNIIEKRRLARDREYNIMRINTITDPIVSLKNIVVNPRTIEIYFEDNKRKALSLVDPVEFVAACLFANKRIHCNVKAYNEVARKFEKRNRKQEEKMRKHGYKMDDE